MKGVAQQANWDKPQPTLQERLVSEAREKAIWSDDVEQTAGFQMAVKVVPYKEVEKIILHTIEQTVKEEQEKFIQIVKELQACADTNSVECKAQRSMCDVYSIRSNRVIPLTDTQHSLRGIITNPHESK